MAPSSRRIDWRLRDFEKKNLTVSTTKLRFIRSWLEKPLSIGAVTPSGKALARTMAAYVDPAVTGPIIELGPGTGPVTEALVERGVDPARLVLVEFDPDILPAAARALSRRPPSCRATPIVSSALLAGVLREPAAAVVSGLPLFTKPLQDAAASCSTRRSA